MKDIDFEQELYKHFGQVKDFTLGMRIGQYFYELGCTRTAEKYNEIEYNRQREEEKPMDLDEELNDEIKKYIEEYGYEKGADKLLIAIVARHFAEWQKEQNEKDLSEKIAAAYQLGLDKEKQIMSRAVEGEVENASLGIVYLRKNLVNEGHSTGDKVRIIVLPKED